MNDLFKQLLGLLKGANSGSKAVAVLVGAAMLVVIGVTAIVTNEPHYQLAFSGLSGQEFAKVNKALAEDGISFETSQPPGPFTVYVDEDERSVAYKAVYSAGALDKSIEGISTDAGIWSVFLGNKERQQMVQKRAWEEVEAMLETFDFVVQAKVLAAPDSRLSSLGSHGKGRKHPQQEFLQVDTGNILFICGGAFAGLEKIILSRSSKSGIGFVADVKTGDEEQSVGELLLDVEPEDLIRYGLIPEFVGRLPVVATLEELDEDALVSILLEPKNALTKQYRKLFDMEGVDLVFRDDALRAVAKRAMKRKTGARGLRTILESVLLDTMYDLPSSTSAKKVVLDEAVVIGETKPYVIYESEELPTVNIEQQRRPTGSDR